MQQKVEWKVNDHPIPVYSGSAELKHKFPGVHAPFAINENEPLNITLNIRMKGSNSFSILPTGKKNQIEIAANWPDPSFIGQFLPNIKINTKKNFQAAQHSGLYPLSPLVFLIILIYKNWLPPRHPFLKASVYDF